jgi:hypothetical protein
MVIVGITWKGTISRTSDFKWHIKHIKEKLEISWGFFSFECHVSCSVTIGTRSRWVVSFTPWLLYPWGNHSWYPLARRLGGFRSRSGCYEEKSCSCQELNPSHPARCYTDWAITPSWKCCTGTKSLHLYVSVLCVCLYLSVWKSVRLNLPVVLFS